MTDSIKNNEDARLLAALQKMLHHELEHREWGNRDAVDYDAIWSLEQYEDHSECRERMVSKGDCVNKSCYFSYETKETSFFGDIASLKSDIETIRGAYYNVWDDTDPDSPELFSYTTSEYSEYCSKLEEVDGKYKDLAAQKGDK